MSVSYFLCLWWRSLDQSYESESRVLISWVVPLQWGFFLSSIPILWLSLNCRSGNHSLSFITLSRFNCISSKLIIRKHFKCQASICNLFLNYLKKEKKEKAQPKRVITSTKKGASNSLVNLLRLSETNWPTVLVLFP